VKGRAQPGLNFWRVTFSVWALGASGVIMPPMTEEITEDVLETQDQHQTVLVVDDMSDNLILISLSLQDMGYRVVTANNGEDALNVAKLARPDLILMDIAMPHQDGLAATRRIREESELQEVPVVALTAFDTDGFRQAAFDAGFNGYLTKPIDFDRLKKLMRMLLSGGKTSSLA
jgi:CheY-like chemotaxis protein